MVESRERVIEAASELFLGGSFHKIGIAEICETARVNKGTFYHFFPSKLDLLIEVIERYAEACGHDFERVARSSDPASKKLRDVFNVPRQRNQAWKDVHGVSSGCFIGNIILEMAASEPVVRNHAEKAIRDVTLRLQPIVADFLLEQQTYDEEQVPIGAEVLMTLIQGAQIQAKARNEPETFARYAEMAPAMIAAACGKGMPRSN